MDIAFCTQDGRQYTAYEFSNLPTAVIEERRVQLECVECRNPAFYRRETRDGRAPCFGGRPHQSNCSFATQGAGAWGLGGPDEEEGRNNLGNAIVLDLRLDIDAAEETPGGDPERVRRGVGRTYGNEGTRQARSYRRLRSILKSLIKSTAFRNSTQTIELPGVITAQARELFVHFDDIGGGHLGEFHGFWGTLSDARQAGDTTWFNTGGPTKPSIPVSEMELPVIASMAHATELEDFAGAYILVLGRLDQSSGWKRFVSFEDPTRIAIILHG